MKVVQGKEEDFAKILDALPDNEKPTTGTTGKEKVNDFIANREFDVVVKAVIKFQLEDETYQQTIQDEMAAKVEGEKVLSEDEYEKKDGKYTKDAMIKYLFNKKTGQELAMAEKKNDNPSKDPKNHLSQY